MLDPAWENFNPNDRRLVYPIIEVARTRRLPVMFHSGYHPAQPALFLEVARDFVDVPIILAHMGERLVTDALIVAERVPNIYLETSDHMYMLASCVKTLGASRVLFGSNMPFSVPEAEILKITASDTLSDTDKGMVLGGSAARLHGLS
jgi:predicted TIM-barrel fold metal-dependent hydrolase